MTPSSRLESSGQAVLDLLVSLSLVTITLSGSGYVLYAQWKRAKCAYLAFESAHARLKGVIRLPLPRGDSVTIQESPDEVKAQALCGDARESVRLKRLEAVQW